MTFGVDVALSGTEISLDVSLDGGLTSVEILQPAPISIELSLTQPGPEGPKGQKGDTGEAGLQGPAGPQGWISFAVHWEVAPTQVGSTAAGAVYAYTLDGVTRYRLVPTPYSAEQDAFYSDFSGGVLSGLVVSRG